MTRRLYLGDVNNVTPAWYNVSFWVPGLEALDEKVHAYGQGAQVDFDLWAEREGLPIPVLPKSGMEVLYYDHNAGSPLLHKYLVGGRISADFPLPVAEDKHYRIEVDGFEEDFTAIIPYMVFYQSIYATDSSRVTALIQDAVASFGLKGTWDAGLGVGGPFITYKPGSYNDYNLKSIAYILADITMDPGQPTDSGYKVPSRRYYVSCQWSDPSNPGVGGANALVRVLYYYSGSRAYQEHIPLTDRPDGKAYYAYDTFSRAASTTDMGTSEIGQVWAALVGTWGIDGSARAYLQGNGGQNMAVLDAYVSDAEVGVTAPTVAAAQRLAFRISSHPATGYKWQGFILQNGGSDYSLYRYELGAFTLLHSYAVTPANGDVLKVVLSGNTITPYINGIAQAAVTDAFNNTATLYGISSDIINVARYDAFYVWAKAARYHKLRVGNDRTAVINIVTIAGPGSDPAPVSWGTNTGTQGAGDGDLTKSATVDAWDAFASSAEQIVEDGGSVTATAEQVRKVQDGFDRPDNTALLGTAPSGQAWQLLGTAPVAGITGNKAYFVSGTGPLYAYVDSGVATCISEVKFGAVATGARLLFRMTDAANLWFVEAQASSYKLYKRVAGVETLMGTHSVTPANGDVVKVSCEDAVIKFYLNGAGPFITVTDAAGQQATKHGWGTASALTPRYDDFSVWQTYADMAFGIGPLATVPAGALDNFDRADSSSTLGTAQAGGAWAVLGTSAVWGIQSNRAYAVSGSGPLYAYLNAGVPSGVLQVTLSTVATGARVLFRETDASNLWFVEAQASSYKLYKRQTGSDTLMATYTVTPANGDVIKVALDDNAIQVYLNGAGPIATITDAFNNTATRHGIGVSGTTAPRFDDFSVYPTLWKQIAFGWRINAAARTAQPAESGTLVSSAVAYVQGDRFKVAVRPVVTGGGIIGYQVRYYQNDVQKYLSAISPSPSATTPYFAQGAIYHRGATLSNVTVKLFSYSTFTNDVSIGKWGPKPHKTLIKRDDLDTREKRQALGDAILQRHPDPHQTVDLDTLQEYGEGHIVLLNSQKMGWQNYRQVIAAMKRKLKAMDQVTYQLQIGEADIEWLDDDPLGFMLQSQIEDRTEPQPPQNFAQSQGVVDGPNTVTHNFTWDKPKNDARWLYILFSPVGGPVFERRLPAQSGAGAVNSLPTSTPYRVRACFEDWNRNRSAYTSPALDIVTAALPVLAAPGSLTQTSNQYNALDDLAQVAFTWTAPPDPLGLVTSGYEFTKIQNGQRAVSVVTGQPVGASLLFEPGLPYIFELRGIDRFGRLGDTAIITGTAAGRVYDELFNPSFEDIERVPIPVGPKGWTLDLGDPANDIVWDHTTAGDGAYSVKFDYNSGALPTATSDLFRMSDRITYQLSGQGKSATGSAGDAIIPIFEFFDEDFVSLGTQNIELGMDYTTSWARYRGSESIAPLSGTRYATLEVHPNSAVATWVDALDLRPSRILQPDRLQAGPLLGVPEAGASEYDGNAFYLTPTIDRHAIRTSSTPITATTSASNTASEIPVFTGSISANELKVARQIILRLWASHKNGLGGSETGTLKVKMNGVLVLAAVAVPSPGTGAKPVYVEYTATQRTVGSGGTHIDALHTRINSVITDQCAAAAGGLDTTVAQDITVTFQWSAARSGTSFDVTQAVLEFVH